MFGIEHYWIFLLSGIILNLTPGTDTMYILGRSISQGKDAGIMSALGISSGIIVHTLLASFGLSVILANSIIAFKVIKYIGAAYLIFLGLKALFTNYSSQTFNNRNNDTMLKVYIQGLLTNVLNPKVALFFLAFLPQFIHTNNTYGPIPFLILGLTFVTTATIWCLILAIFSSLITNKLRNNQMIYSFLNRVTGILFIGLGINLVRK